ncbi:MAG: hypothetical protein KatS3mg110_4484 [Pirellulaceae bacterium]|nr:MAG: hypothetical protein KatS3mg110_4484 [Pirellulaceae bacterium]
MFSFNASFGASASGRRRYQRTAGVEVLEPRWLLASESESIHFSVDAPDPDKAEQRFAPPAPWHVNTHPVERPEILPLEDAPLAGEHQTPGVWEELDWLERSELNATIATLAGAALLAGENFVKPCPEGSDHTGHLPAAPSESIRNDRFKAARFRGDELPMQVEIQPLWAEGQPNAFLEQTQQPYLAPTGHVDPHDGLIRFVRGPPSVPGNFANISVPEGELTIPNNFRTENRSLGGAEGEGGLTSISGTLSSDTMLSGTVHVTGDLQVAAGVTLTLLPGTVVKVASAAFIDVRGTLSAQGTADLPIIFTSFRDDSVGIDVSGPGTDSGQPGDWEALYFTTGNPQALLEHVEIRFAGDTNGPTVGGGATPAIEISSTSVVAFRDVLVRDVLSTGIDLLSGAPVLDRVRVERAGGVAFVASLVADPTLSNLTATATGGDHFLLRSGTITAATRRWFFGGLPVHLAGDLTVAQGSHLTIDPGLVIKVPSAAFIDIKGKITAIGSDDEPIIFTSVEDDSAGGDSNSNGAATTPRAGDWEALYLTSGDPGVTLDHVEIRFAGDTNGQAFGGGETPALQIAKDSVTISNLLVRDVKHIGVRLQAGTPRLENVSVHRAGNVAFDATLAVDPTLIGLSAAATGGDYYQLAGGTIPSSNRVWDFGGLPVHLAADLTVEQERKLVLVPGTIVKVRPANFIWIKGTLEARGTASQPIIFTSELDDTAGGDSNRDGTASAPFPGAWEALYIDGPDTILENVDIRYAGDTNGPAFGGGETASLQIRAGNSNVVIRNTRVLYGLWTGIYISAGDPRLEQVHVEGNGREAVFLELAANPTFVGLTASANRFNNITLAAGTIPQATRTLDSGGPLPFHVTGDLRVAQGNTLTLVPGTVLKFPPAAFFHIQGTLIGQGTLTRPIVLTSDRDDTAGGDSNGDGAASAPFPGAWEALYIDGPDTILENVDIRYAGDTNGPASGGGETASLQIRTGNSNVVIRNTRVLYGLWTGIYISAGNPRLEQVHVEGNGREAVFLELAANPTFVGLTASANRFNNITLAAGTIPQATRTLDSGGPLPFHVTGDLRVAQGNTLTLVPGTVLKFPPAAFFHIQGTLIGQGTLTRPIVLTSDRDDTAGGDSNGDGAASAPFPGAWEALYIDGPDTILENVDIRYAGDTNGPAFGGGETASLQIRTGNSNVVIRNTRVLYGLWTGIYISAGNPRLEQVHVEGNGREAVFLELAANPTFVGLTASANRFNNITLAAGTIPQATRTLDSGGPLPFHVTGDLRVAQGNTLTLLPGTVLKFPPAAFFHIQGTLIGQGTLTRPIVLTSDRDDTAGGDSNGDGAASAPFPGAWEALYIQGAGSELEYVQVRYAGDTNGPSFGGGQTASVHVLGDAIFSQFQLRSGLSDGIRVSGANLTLNDGVLSDNLGIGLLVESGTATVARTGFFAGNVGVRVNSGASSNVSDSAFENFATAAAQHLGTNSAFARFLNNWWGDAGGPHDPSAADGQVNINPAGQRVSDFLEYQPFRTARPALPIGPFVVSVEPRLSSTPVNFLDVTFSEPVTAFDPSDVSISGPRAPPVATIEHVRGATYRMTLTAPLDLAGLYTISMGPDIVATSSNLRLDRDRDGLDGETPDDRFEFPITLDFTGPRVVAQTPSGTVQTVVESVEVQFSKTIDAATFTAEDVTLNGPSGSIRVLAVDRLAADRFAVRFAKQIANGTYTLRVGPEIADLAGNLLDQNNNGINGETEDSYQGTFTIALQPLRIIDQQPSGLVRGSVTSIDVSFSAPINAGTFGVDDVLITGPAQVVVVAVAPLSASSARITVQRITREGTYTLRIGPAVLDLAGRLMDQDGDNIPGEIDDQYVGSFTVGGVGPTVVGQSPTGTVKAPVSAIEIAFSEEIRVESVTPLAFQLSGPLGAIGITRITALSPVRFRAEFPPQTATGNYTIRVGPQITDTTGVPMDQDGDGINGELLDDVYTGTFSIDNTPLLVLSATPQGDITAPFGSIEVEFSEPVLASSFTPSDITIIGPQGPVTSISITRLAEARFRISFPQQAATGTYRGRWTPSCGPREAGS